MAPDPDSSELLDQKGTKFIQTIVGIFIYYARALDPTMLHALNDISCIQARPTRDKLAKAKWFIDYAATYLNTIIRYHASKMVLQIDSDAAYLVMPEARSAYSGNFYLSNWPCDKPNLPSTKRNGPILTTRKTIRKVVSSAAEAETTGTFCNAKEGVAILPSLIGIGHKQPPTPLKTENSTTDGFVNSSMKPKKSKTWDMNMYWLRDKEFLKQIQVYWDKGKNNDTDYFTMHFLPVFTSSNDLVIFNQLILKQHQSLYLKPSSQDCARVC